MEYNSFMEALKGKQHKIDKNKNNKIDAQDFEILRKEETEELDEIHRMKTKLNKLDPISNRSVARQKLTNLMKSGKARGALIANKMRTLNMGDDIDQEDLDALHEVLSKDAKASDWIHDFVHSTNPKFEGKSKKERIKMALGAYYGKQRNEGYQSYSGPSHGHAYGGSGFGRREREDDEYHVPDPTPVAPVPARKYIKGTPENKAAKEASKSRTGHPTNEEISLDEGIDPSEIAGNPSMYSADSVKKAYYHKNASESDKQSLAHHLDRHHGNKEWRKPVKEEQEQIDELSKNTLGSYIKKAADSATVTRKIGTDFEHMADKSRKSGNKAAATELADKYKAQSRARRANIGKAVDRLTKEEVEQIELEEAKMTTTKDKSGKMISFKYEGDWKKAIEKKQGAGKAANLAGQAMQKMAKANEAKEDPAEYDQEGDMAKTQLRSIKYNADELHEMIGDNDNLPEWVQSKLTLAQDYIQTVCDYMNSKDEVNEEKKSVTVKVNAAGDAPHEEKWEAVKKVKKPVAEAVQKVDIPAYLRKAKGDTPLKMDDLKRKDTLSDAENLKRNRGVKESFDDEGNLIPTKISYKDFITEIKLADLPVRRIQGHSYGANYSDPEGADDYDDKKPMKPAAEKRGRGRPAGAKSGARKITGTSKLMNK